MADPRPATLTVTTAPDPAQQQDVLALVSRAAEHDGHRPVNDAGLLALRPTRGGLADRGSSRPATSLPVHVLAHDPGSGALVGYAQAIEEEDGPVAAVVVDPDHRRHGVGGQLWRRLAAETPGSLRVWATGDTPAARALAASLGLRRIRTLQVLGRTLDGDLPPTQPPAGVSIRTFRPGQDEDGWLGVNARAFAHHPEQGSLTRADLDQRMAEPWFDPAGFFVAVRDPAVGPASGPDGPIGSAGSSPIVGFHWTKREPGASTGEVYVIGVDPTAGVRGLGTPLLGVGLRHLRDGGARDVDLYVEADNEAAVALYKRLGFAESSVDIQYHYLR
jgi:mycothiol synthase